MDAINRDLDSFCNLVPRTLYLYEIGCDNELFMSETENKKVAALFFLVLRST